MIQMRNFIESGINKSSFGFSGLLPAQGLPWENSSVHFQFIIFLFSMGSGKVIFLSILDLKISRRNTLRTSEKSKLLILYLVLILISEKIWVQLWTTFI